MDAALREILPLLRCPEKRVPLRPATAEEVARLNARIQQGALANVGGNRVAEPLTEALVRDGGDVAYPIREDIPILIVEEGLPLAPPA